MMMQSDIYAASLMVLMAEGKYSIHSSIFHYVNSKHRKSGQKNLARNRVT